MLDFGVGEVDQFQWEAAEDVLVQVLVPRGELVQQLLVEVLHQRPALPLGRVLVDELRLLLLFVLGRLLLLLVLGLALGG